MTCLKASAAADALPGFKDLNEEQKYHVYNAPYTAAVTGEDVADIIDKLLAASDEAPALGTLLATRARFDPDHYKPWGRARDKHDKEEWIHEDEASR